MVAQCLSARMVSLQTHESGPQVQAWARGELLECSSWENVHFIKNTTAVVYCMYWANPLKQYVVVPG